jgi:hypothetical protein
MATLDRRVDETGGQRRRRRRRTEKTIIEEGNRMPELPATTQTNPA